MQRIGIGISMLAIALAVAAGRAMAEEREWACWRGPCGNGTAPEEQWNPGSLFPSPKIIWQNKIGQGHSCVAICRRHLYTMGNIENKDIVYCLEIESGKEVWRFSYPCKAGSFPGPRATPVVNGNAVYTFSRQGQLYCLDADSGKVKWQRDLPAEFGAKNLMHGFSSSPYLEGDAVVINAGRNGMAFHRDTGEKLWISDAEGPGGYATPVAAERDGKRCAAILTGKALYGIDAKSGVELWSYPWQSEYDLNAADPLVSGNLVFISTWDDKGSALLDIGGTSPKLLWQTQKLKNTCSSSVLVHGYIYGFEGDPRSECALKCLEFAGGEEKWSRECEYGSLIVAGDKLIILDQMGYLAVVHADPSSYREIGNCRVFPASKQVRCWTAPVLCGGMLYCRNSAGDLVCIDVRP